MTSSTFLLLASIKSSIIIHPDAISLSELIKSSQTSISMNLLLLISNENTFPDQTGFLSSLKAVYVLSIYYPTFMTQNVSFFPGYNYLLNVAPKGLIVNLPSNLSFFFFVGFLFAVSFDYLCLLRLFLTVFLDELFSVTFSVMQKLTKKSIFKLIKTKKGQF